MDTATPGLAGAPGRMARALAELLTPRAFSPTTLPNDEHEGHDEGEGYDELVLARGIPFRSVREHHLRPLVGVAHVGSLPGDRIVGLSKLARVVAGFAAAPQVQERLTSQVASWLDAKLAPRRVGVVLAAEDSRVSPRGGRAAGARTRTSALRGLVRGDARTRAEFFTLAGESGF